MIEYRKAVIDDIDILVKMRIIMLYETDSIENETEKARLSENNKLFLRKAISDNSFISFVAIDNGEIIATSGLSLFNLPPNKKCADGKVAYISNMYTIPGYRKRGIASQLFSMTVRESVRLGHKKILLNATETGRSIYEKFGFKGAKNDMVYYAE